MRFRLVPTDDRFFDLFVDSAKNLRDAAEELQKMLGDLGAAEQGRARVAECERRGDELTRDTLARLHHSFVTPFDREDIHELTELLDDVTDDVFHVADLLHLLRITEPLPEMVELVEILTRMAANSVDMFERFESMKGLDDVLAEIGRLESDGDRIYRQAMARLFEGSDPMTVLKWKDIIAATESALNRLEDVSDVVESICVKHA